MTINENDLKAVLLFLGAAWLAVAWFRRRYNRESFGSVSLAILIFLAILSVMRFHEMVDHAQMERYRNHELYHYLIGAKYYDELGHNSIYNCTLAAMQTLHDSGRPVPNISSVRDLSTVWQFKPAVATGLQQMGECRARFSPGRWVEFTHDIGLFLSLGSGDKEWERMLNDFGNNPPPTWAVIASPVANLIPLDTNILGLLYIIDVAILFLAIPYLLYRTYGIAAALLYLIVYTNNPLFPASWDGGSYFRHLWLLALTAGFCALHTARYTGAGALLALSGLLRVFPALFLVGAALPLLYAFRERRADLLRLSAGAAAMSIGLIAASLLVFSVDHWREFFSVIELRASNLGANTFGYLKHAVSYHTTSPDDIIQPRGLGGIHDWFALMRGIYVEHRVFNFSLIATFIAAAALATRRLSCALASLLFATTVLFFLTTAYSYYYAFLALFVPVLLVAGRPDKEWPRLLAIMLFLVVGAVEASWYARTNSEIMGLVMFNSVYSTQFMLFMAALLIWRLIEQYPPHLPWRWPGTATMRPEAAPRAPTPPWSMAAYLLGIGIVTFSIASYFSDPRHAEEREHYIETQDIARHAVVGRISDRTLPVTDNWYLGTLTVFEAANVGDTLRLTLPVQHTALYKVVAYFGKSDDFCVVAMGLPGLTQPITVDLWSHGTMLTVPAHPLVIGPVTLRPGDSDLEIRVVGRNASINEQAYKFGIDGIQLIPIEGGVRVADGITAEGV